MKKIGIASCILLWTVILSAASISFQEALDRLQGADAPKYPESDQVYLYQSEIQLDEHCLGSSEYESFRKVLTEKGKDDSMVRFSYHEHYSSVDVLAIEQVKSDGSIRKYDPDTFLTKNQDASSKSSNIYSENNWVLTGELENLEIGDIVYTRYRRTKVKARMNDQYFDQLMLEHQTPILFESYHLSMPADRKLYIHEKNVKGEPFVYEYKVEGDRQIHDWVIHESPIIIPEPSMEQEEFFAGYIMLTTLHDWKEVSRWYYGLVASHLEIDQAIKDKTDELVKGKTTRRDKAASIFYWVAQNIRYVGVDREKDRPGYEPHDVTYTFETRGGVCRDKAALLVAMFRYAGIGADPILISVGYQLPMDAPCMWFNHAIAVSYDEAGEPEFFFDPTNENTRDFLPQYEEDCSYIIASEKSDVLRIIPISPSSRNKSTIALDMKIDEDFAAKGTITFGFYGMGDTVMRSALMNMRPQRKMELIKHFVTSMHPQATLVDAKLPDARDVDSDLEIQAKFEIPGYIDLDNDRIFMPLEASKLSMSFLYNYVLSPFRLTERKYPFKLPFTFSLSFEQTVSLPIAMRTFSAPDLPEIQLDGFGFQSDYEYDEKQRRFQASSKFAIDDIHFTAQQYKTMKRELGKLEKLDQFYLIGEK